MSFFIGGIGLCPSENGRMDRLKRGAAEIIPEPEFDAKLKSGKPLRIKLGIDPTAPDIHLGHSVVLRKLRHFQEAGHKVVLIIGDYTARIGDPSGRSETRKVLAPGEIEANTQTYLNQIGKILDTKDNAHFELRYNSEWLSPLKFDDILLLAHQFTVAQLLEREDFAKRYRERQGIGLHEFFYPIMQGYDSVAIKADVELGGTDQKFNILVGRELQRMHGNPSPQIVFLMPILEGTDGVQKMSKSLGNYIGITDSADQMFGKVMSIPDRLIPRYFELLTDRSMDDIKNMGPVATFGRNPREWKAELGEMIVASYHGPEAGKKARQNFDRVFQEKKAPDDIPEFLVPADLMNNGTVSIAKLLVAANLAPSMREAKRLLSQGAVEIDGNGLTAENPEIKLSNGMVLKSGKRQFVRLKLS